MYGSQFKKYIEDLAAKLPAPGGGSAAALVGATGAALMEMVANFTVGKKKYASVEEDVKSALSACTGIRRRLVELIDEDVDAYRKLDAALKGQKAQEIQVALKDAASVPLEICNLSHEALKLVPALLEKGNSNLISDVGVAASFLSSAFESALYNVNINLKEIDDKDFVVKVSKALEIQKEEVAAVKDAASSRMAEALSAGEKKQGVEE